MSIRPYWEMMVVNKSLIRPYLLGEGGIAGVPLDKKFSKEKP